jgi:hypothetical protein
MALNALPAPESVRTKFHNFHSAFSHGTATTEKSAAMAVDISSDAALAMPVTRSAAVTFPLAKALPRLSPERPPIDDLR